MTQAGLELDVAEVDVCVMLIFFPGETGLNASSPTQGEFVWGEALIVGECG